MPWLTTGDAAKLLNITPTTVRNLIHQGVLPAAERNEYARSRYWLKAKDVRHYRATRQGGTK